MAKNKPTPPPEPEGPSSETVRVSTDLIEMMREICFHSRDERGRRLKLAQFLDSLLRPAVTKAYSEFQQGRGGE